MSAVIKRGLPLVLLLACVTVCDWTGVSMGNLLKVLYSRENDSPNRVDIFVDFESTFSTYCYGIFLSFLVRYFVFCMENVIYSGG